MQHNGNGHYIKYPVKRQSVDWSIALGLSMAVGTIIGMCVAMYFVGKWIIGLFMP